MAGEPRDPDQPTRPAARIHSPTRPADTARIRELQGAWRRDIRHGAILISLLAALSFGLSAVEMRPGLLVWAGVFWAAILLIRGIRLRREAWELEHLGFIEREKTNPK
jgi:hypothetical protein